MAISEADRHLMYLKLEEVLGAEAANTVMEHLPPVGWADVATKHDLDALQVLMKQDLDLQTALFKKDLEAGLAGIRAEVSDRLRAQTWVVCTTLIAGMGVFAAIARA